jgi:hypothetical protein
MKIATKALRHKETLSCIFVPLCLSGPKNIKEKEK